MSVRPFVRLFGSRALKFLAFSQLSLSQGFSMGLCRSSVRVVRPGGELSDLAVVLAVSPDLVHHGVRGLLREEDGLGHVVIVILNENQNESEVL